MIVSDLAVALFKSVPAKVWHAFVEWIRMALGRMATAEFWVELCEKILTQMWNAFVITLGGRIASYGVSREDPEIKKFVSMYGVQPQPVPAAAAAFAGSQVRPDYASSYVNRASDFSRPYAAPVQSPVDRSFPGFGSLK